VPAYVWHNALDEPSPTVATALFEPPPDLTNGRHEIWIAAAGGARWGGCEVWASINDQSYDKIGVIGPGCVVGIISSPLLTTADPVTLDEVRVDVAMSRGMLYPGARSDADMFSTACLIGDELIAYTGAQLYAPHLYRLTGYMRRGIFGSPIGNHQPGDQFVRLNQSIFRFEFPPNLVGQRVHVKLPAFNEFNQMMEGLDAVGARDLVLTGASAQARA
jgi:hypothetical protein